MTVALARSVEVTDDELAIVLTIGETIHIPIRWFPALKRADRVSREHCVLRDEGLRIAWPDVPIYWGPDSPVVELSVGMLASAARAVSESPLAWIGEDDVVFRDDSFRWIDILHFGFVGSRGDEALLGALISHPEYSCGFIGGPRADPARIHAMYSLDGIDRNSFVSVDPIAAEQCIDDFCTLEACPPPTPECAAKVETRVRRVIRAADSIYRLKELGGALHDGPQVLWEFREIVAITRDPASLTLIVTGID